MELGFLGGAGEVGRSCISLSTRETTVYLDCGLKMQEEGLPLLKNAKLPDAVILSHSHLDHSGAIPLLFKHGAPTVYCTTPCIALCEVLFNDTLKIAQQEKKPPLFSQGDVKKSLNRFSALGYANEFTLNNDVSFSFLDAGHIIGSAQISIEIENKQVVYTGDVKLKETRMHAGADVPKKPDALIMECTYGNKSQPDRQKLEETFFEQVQEIIGEGGVALVPCFAIGRTQEIISLLSEKNFRGDIYIEGMGAVVNEIYSNYSGYLKNPRGFKTGLKRVKQIRDKSERKRALEGGVIICTAGMLEGGPVLGYLQQIEKNEINAKLFLTGFQAPETNGRRLLNNEPLMIRTNRGAAYKRFSIPFKHFEFSAHADERELLEYVERTNPEKVFCMHGDDTTGFAHTLKQRGFDAYAPRNGEKVKI